MAAGNRGVSKSAVAAALLAAALTLPDAARAQQSDPLPSREQVEIPEPEDTRGRSRVRVDAEGAVQTAPCPLDRYDLNVNISSVRFTGAAGAPLSPALAPLLNRIGPPPGGEQAIRVVCDVRDRATELLRREGYVASVQIPPQTIETGELRLEVVTARIVEVRVRGDAAPYRGTLAGRIDQLRALDPLNERDAERILLLAGDVPGLDVQLQLRPAGTVPGEVVGDLEVRYTRASFLANVQNYGSKQLGRETAYLRGEVYGLTGSPGVTYAGVSSTVDIDEQQVVQVGHVAGLNRSGLSLGGSFLYAWSRPDVGLLDLRSESLIARLEIAEPAIRSLRRNLTVRTGLELIEQRTRVFSDAGGLPLNRDKLRVAFLRLEGGIREPTLAGTDLYSIGAAIEVRRGLDILNATKRREISPGGFTPSRIEGDPTATVVRGEIDGVVALGSALSLAIEGIGQWANNPLLNFEEFSLGNLTIGRGYDPGANSADRAVAFRVEPRAKLFENERLRAELFGFHDSVWIWNLDPNAVEDNRTLRSYGAGIRILLPRLALFEAMYARPEDKALLVPDARRAPDRLLLSLTLQFSPGRR
jgi:hemolysin activation/secretion protein